MARLTECPEIAITPDDGKAFLSAVQNVARHYPITATQKTLDWAALIITTGLIYTPRVIAIQQRRDRERNPRQAAPQMGQVFTFHPGGQQQPPGAASEPEIIPPAGAEGLH